MSLEPKQPAGGFVLGVVVVGRALQWTLALGLATVAARAAAPADRVNVLFIVADDLRADALGFGGNPIVRTPNLDALARRGAVFARATCSYPICHVSRSEMFSGRLLLGAGEGAVKFDPAWTLWPQAMQRGGWHTVYSGKWHVAGTPRADGFAETAGLFSSGGAVGMPLTLPTTPTGRKVTGYTGWTFKTPDNKSQPELGVGLTPNTDRIIADRAIEALHRNAGRPFFHQIAFTAPHDPLHWPEGPPLDAGGIPLPRNFRPQHPFETGNLAGRDEKIVPVPRSAEDVKKERAIYFRLVENLDRQIGRIVRALEEEHVLERTLIIFTSDHGLALGSHGLMGKQNQYEHTIGVPLVLAGPGIEGGRRFDAQCYLRDLYPTVCELAEMPVPATVEGRSLRPVLRGEKTAVYDAIFGYFTGMQRMIRTNDGWKLVWYPQVSRYQLFHVTADPDELHDLAAEPEQQARVAELKTALTQWQRDHGDPVLKEAR